MISSVLLNFIKLFKNEGIELSFTEQALREVAKVSMEKKTGARSLNSSLELLLADIQFEHLGSESDVKEIKITKKMVTDKLR